ncbi:acetylserotonin O-methyltransferase 2 isoform X1 [Fundulus heteroclitus]|uniref:acetylserotonin O-methyltransferase 2 isoform X1 n=2 Tax=Fundulus heteroclitus TaxID=8078 RepID=UPI00165BFFE9|nr:acetylserotonin O-methyltransferase 2 isoform X1 [Fundulus heteroclitus]XP_036006776.1 acetylserotonin O-methyltransferase 2 isoform X1 [Fundulus heteroclitus]
MAEHLSQSELDYPFKLLEYFNGFRVSKVIFSACELGVFDLLLKSQEAMSAQRVAQELGTSVDGMERLLDALVGLEILEVERAEGTAFYSSTDVANLYLAKGSAKSLHDMIVYRSQTIYPLWNNMVDAIREGKNQYEKTFGLPSEDVFQAIYRSEEEMLKFMGLMNSSWVLDGHDVVTAFDLSRFQRIVDLGGCTGALANELARAYPASSITVFDLPEVVEAAQKHYSQEDNRVAFQSGDFFRGEIPSADLYVLARIVHDWSEEKCLALLKKIYETCQPGGGVLLVEALLFENKRGPLMVQIFSLNMLVQAEGKERSPSEYTNMLNKSGFRDVQVCRTGKSYDAILAIR